MSEQKELATILQNIHSGDAWHGPSLHELLADITPEQAAARRIPGVHTIYELVRHISAWEKVFTRRLEGEAVTEPEEGDFPTISEASTEAWRQAQEDFDVAHSRLINRIEEMNSSDLDRQVSGKGYNVRFLLNGLVRHHVYHAGQIALLKKAFR